MNGDDKMMQQDHAAENLCRWAAARAGVIVVAPGIGTMALIANEIYMVIRIGRTYETEISQTAAFGFVASLGAAFVGQTLATLIPLAPMQVPVGVSVTYAVGKAAQAWIKAGTPSDLTSIRQIFASVRKAAKTNWRNFISHPDKEVPLGDESTNILLLAQGISEESTRADYRKAESGRERLQRLAGLKEEVTWRIAKLPFGHEIIGPALDYIFNDPHIRQVMDAIQNPRPLRIVFVGRTGAGKSSVINALAGKYLAEISDPVPGQQCAEKHCIYDGDRILFEVVDTRGIADAETGAEAELEKAFTGFQPDIMMLVIPMTDRSHMDEDIRAVKQIHKKYFKGAIPFIALLTKADQMAPPQERIDEARKQTNIQAFSARIAGMIQDEGLTPIAILPVCSYIDWSEDKQDMVYDGRYNIDQLQRLICENVALEAALQLAVEGKIRVAARMVAERLVHACAALAGTIGGNPLPVADITVLTSLQVIMVTAVAYLGGRDLDEKGVREFITGLGFHIPAALALRELARVLAPFFGGVISGAVAAGGTYAIGLSAVAYYIDEKPQSALADIFKEAQTWVGKKVQKEGVGFFNKNLK
ncbi:MAG: GTPase [Negativicutes bacterium]